MQQQTNGSTQNVQVIGVRIGFWEMVVLLVKFALAAIPAAIILWIVGALLVWVVGGISLHR